MKFLIEIEVLYGDWFFGVKKIWNLNEILFDKIVERRL